MIGIKSECGDRKRRNNGKSLAILAHLVGNALDPSKGLLSL